MVVKQEVAPFFVTSRLAVTRPEHGQLGFFCLDWSMSALAIMRERKPLWTTGVSQYLSSRRSPSLL
jgi:hypothetical protein